MKTEPAATAEPDICAWAQQFHPFMPELQDDPHPYVEQMRERCPVVFSEARGGYWVVSRYEDARFVLQRHDLFSARINTTPVSSQTLLSRDIPNQVDPPEHAKYRSLINPVLSLKMIDEFEPIIRESAVRHLEGIAARGRCNFTTEFAVPFPGEVFCDLMGLPRADLPTLVRWKNDIFAAVTPEEKQAVAATVKVELADYFIAQYHARTSSGEHGDDLLSRLTTGRYGGERDLTMEEWIGIAAFFWVAGLHTVTAQLGFAMDYLSTHLDHRDQLVADPLVMEHAVEELIRYDSLVNDTRVATADVELGGAHIKEGDVVLVLYGLAGRDPEQFENPDDVDFTRSPNRHLGFGAGIHRCAGSHLARREMLVALEEIHRIIPRYRRDESNLPIRRYGWVRDLENLHLIVE